MSVHFVSLGDDGISNQNKQMRREVENRASIAYAELPCDLLTQEMK